jgi:hypothetical protein
MVLTTCRVKSVLREAEGAILSEVRIIPQPVLRDWREGLIDGQKVVDFLLDSLVTACHSRLLANQINLAQEEDRGNIAVWTKATALVKHQ